MDAQAITPHLKKINAFISQSQSGDKTNSALLTNIDDKSNEFLQRLVAIHPKLTQGEKYLATLLRVNLSTKEISMLTGTTPKTINMNRYRLRKSLNLSSEEDLTDYLQNIKPGSRLKIFILHFYPHRPHCLPKSLYSSDFQR